VAADVDAAAVVELADVLNTDRPAVLAVPTDVRDEAQLVALVERTLHDLGGLDVLVNNAGVFRGDDGRIGELEAEVWDDVMAVNVRGPMLLTRHALPALVASGHGVVLNTASTHSMGGDRRLSAYGASKAALNALSQYVATQYGKQGVRCNAVCPGATATPPLRRGTPEVLAVYDHHTLNPRINGPADLAKVYAFLASDDSFGINGMVLRVDGGLLAHQPYTPDLAALAAAATGPLLGA
jgi:NAD(P)-dependent dehydrogenase (short-subunit alcohol dehydrogenase family)